MEEIDIALITKRSIRGIFALTTRTFTIQIISLISNFLLTIFLSPTIFGVFFVVSAAIAFLSYFSDIGLAAALIQKKEKITDDDLKTTFTIQQILVISIVLIAILASEAIGSFYNLNDNGILLFQALSASFFLSSLKTIPSIILERSLRFEKLVIPQIVETLVFSILAVTLAIKGFGVNSFTIAVLGRGMSGLIAMYIIAPWKIQIGISRESASKLLSFGIPFQANSFLALVKDDLLIAYLGKILPLAEVGYIGFAQKWALTPLRLIMDNVIRITFPSFSRLQNEKETLSKALEKSIFVSTFVIFPSLVVLVLLSPYFINLIPKYTKWEPALLALGFFSLNAGLSSISTPLTNALNAIGKIRITLYLMVFWTGSIWILTPIAIYLLGFNGVAIASAIVSMSVIFVIIIVRKYIPFSILKAASYPLLGSIVLGIFMYFLSPLLIKDFTSLIFMIVLSIVVYFLTSFLLVKEEILGDLRLVRNNLRK